MVAKILSASVFGNSISPTSKVGGNMTNGSNKYIGGIYIYNGVHPISDQNNKHTCADKTSCLKTEI